MINIPTAEELRSNYTVNTGNTGIDKTVKDIISQIVHACEEGNNYIQYHNKLHSSTLFELERIFKEKGYRAYFRMYNVSYTTHTLFISW